MSELVRLDAPAVPARLPERLDTIEELAAGWLMRFGPNTRDAYGRDLRRRLEWCAPRWASIASRHPPRQPLQPPPARGPRRTYRPAPGAVERQPAPVGAVQLLPLRQAPPSSPPFADAARPSVFDDSPTTGLNRDELRRLVATAHADGPRSAALIALLAYNGLRISEALSRDVGHLSHDQGHRVLRLERKGGKRATAPLSSPVVRALAASVDERTAGALFITSSGRRRDRPAAWRLVRRLARVAGVAAAEHISPHSARHAFGTGALDAGVPLPDVPDAMGHADPAHHGDTTDLRHSLDRHATYAVAAWLAEG
jgi:integrase/recombinase XerD